MQKLHKGIHNTTRQLSRAITLQRMNFEQTLPTYTTEQTPGSSLLTSPGLQLS